MEMSDIAEALPPPAKETIDLVRKEFGLNENKIKEALEHLKDWMKLQPHLPDDFDDERMERWLIRCKNSLQKVKSTLDMYYTMKTAIPELCTNWNTNTEWFKNMSKLIAVIPLPELTPNKDRVTVVVVKDSNPANFSSMHAFMLNLMTIEIRMREDYCASDIYIYDLKDEHWTCPKGIFWNDEEIRSLCNERIQRQNQGDPLH